MLAAPDLFCQAIPCGAIAGRSGRQDPRVRRELSMDDAGLSDERPDTDVNSLALITEVLKPCPAPRPAPKNIHARRAPVILG
jgi:hypothetical protein